MLLQSVAHTLVPPAGPLPPPPPGPFLVTTMPESAGSQHSMHGHSQRLHVGEAGCVQSWVQML